MGFADEVGAWASLTTSQVRTVRRMIALKVFRRVILRTPVDTGRARANWQATVGSPVQGPIDSVDPTGAGSVSTILPAIGAVQGDEPIFLTNNLPYIERLETGWSQQAPAGMVAITVAEFDGIAEQIAASVATVKGEDDGQF